MPYKLKEDFACYYRGEKLVFRKGDIVEGWPRRRAQAKGVAVRFTPPKEKADESESNP